MTKRHFIALADHIRTWNNGWRADKDQPFSQGQIEELANFCKRTNSHFNRELWLAYIAGECGPNGGEIRKEKVTS